MDRVAVRAMRWCGECVRWADVDIRCAAMGESSLSDLAQSGGIVVS